MPGGRRRGRGAAGARGARRHRRRRGRPGARGPAAAGRLQRGRLHRRGCGRGAARGRRPREPGGGRQRGPRLRGDRGAPGALLDRLRVPGPRKQALAGGRSARPGQRLRAEQAGGRARRGGRRRRDPAGPHGVALRSARAELRPLDPRGGARADRDRRRGRPDGLAHRRPRRGAGRDSPGGTRGTGGLARGELGIVHALRAGAGRGHPGRARRPGAALPTSRVPRPAARPEYSVLDLGPTEALLGPLRPWSESLAECVEALAPAQPAARAHEAAERSRA